MDTKIETGESGGGKIVYVRPVDARDLPAELREKVKEIPNLYGVHTADGDRLALVNGRRLAFALARENEYTPVNVH